MTGQPEIRSRSGRVSAAVQEELPGLGLHWATLRASDGPSRPELAHRLAELADGYRGATVIALRTKPVPAAYRNFFRQIGLDPDVTRPPGEQAALARLFHGTFRSEGRLADALLVALIETGVPLWGLDARWARGDQLVVRTSSDGERLGASAGAHPLAPGTLVVADDARVHSVLFGSQAPDGAVRRDTTEMVLYAISVQGVPSIHVEEAFWLVGEALGPVV